jgi:GNAT superfamily N-acetyltransferase
MLVTTLEMAQRLEEADILHLTRQVEVCTQMFPDQEIVAKSVGHGVAAVTLPSFGRKLNHIAGFGMSGQVSSNDIAVVENLHSKMGIDTEIDLCPHADTDVIQVLASRGYTVNGWINNYVRVITEGDLHDEEYSGIKISQITTEKLDEFPSICLVGFRDNGRPEFLLETLARIAVSRADTLLYLATVDGKIAGSAGLALIETSKGKVAHLYIDSTLPEYRGRGIQAALIRARLSDAWKAGFDLASAGTRPANVSSRNIERAGFNLAYTKTTFVKGK